MAALDAAIYLSENEEDDTVSNFFMIINDFYLCGLNAMGAIRDG